MIAIPKKTNDFTYEVIANKISTLYRRCLNLTLQLRAVIPWVLLFHDNADLHATILQFFAAIIKLTSVMKI